MTIDGWPTAMVTGHRPQFLTRPGVLEWVTDELVRVALKLIEVHGTKTFESGLALGPDQIWGWAALVAQRPLHAHIPFPQQPDVWRDPKLTREWQQLVHYAETSGAVKTYGDLEHVPAADRRRVAKNFLDERNHGMVTDTAAAAGVCVAVLRSSKHNGGTWNAYNAALAAGIQVIRIDPDRRTTVLAHPKTTNRRHLQEALPI